jgi:hypothetical protein
MFASIVGFLDLALSVTAGAVILSWVSDVNKLEACRAEKGKEGRGGGVRWTTSFLASVAALEIILSLGLFMTPEAVPVSVVVGMDIVNVATVVVLLSLDREARSEGGCLDEATAGDWRLQGYTAFASAGAVLLVFKIFVSAVGADFAGLKKAR